MTTRTVPTQFATIASADALSSNGDTIALVNGYSNETATLTHNLTVNGDATDTGIVLNMGAGVTSVTLTGTAPITVNDNAGNDTITATGGTTQNQPSSVTIPAGGSTEIGPASAATATFAGNTGTLKLDNAQSFAGTVAGMVGQDTIDFADITFTNGITTANLMNATSAGGMLHVTDGTHQANIALLGNYMASLFVTASDGHGGSSVVDPQVLGGVQPLATPAHA